MKDVKVKMLDLFQKGLIPIPEETAPQFFKRAEKIFLEQKLVFVSPRLEELYGVKNFYGKIFYSDKGIYFWEAAVSWIYKDFSTEVQLRESFKKRNHFLGYSESEVLDHEAVHAVRAPLESVFFDEFFAYKTSPMCLRRLLGPPLSSKIFIFLIFFLIPGSSTFFFNLGSIPTMGVSIFCFFLGVILFHLPLFFIKKKFKKMGINGEKISFILSDLQIFYFLFHSKSFFFTWLEEAPHSAQKILCKALL